MSILPYSLSRQVLNAVDGTELSLTRREYYNLKKNQTLNAKDESTIEGLLYALDAAGFVYRCRVKEEVNDTGKMVSRKLLQIWFTHSKLLALGARFVAGALCVIDATFNTNKARMPIIVAIGIMNNNATFPLAFSYCQAEDHESYAFFWESLKEHWPPGTAHPFVVVSDQAQSILSSLKEQIPEARHQICEWHAVEAMCAKFRDFHTNLEIKGGKDRDGNVINGIKGFAWQYVQSTTFDELERHRKALCDHLKPGGKEYIEKTWRPKESRVIRCYTALLFNLGCNSSQRSESYHVVLKQMTNGQLSLENSAIMLAKTVNQLIQDVETSHENDIKSYPRLAQSQTFKNLRLSITSFALTKIALEWDLLCRIAPQNPPRWGRCECELLLRFGLPCVHYLYSYYLTGEAIPRTLCHPRWWIEGGPITTIWAPFTEYLPAIRAPPEPLFTDTERRLMEMVEHMNAENRHRFSIQRERGQERLNEEMVTLGARRLQLQALPINNPDPVPRHQWARARAHERSGTRLPTANELRERQQRQEARQVAEQTRVSQTNEEYKRMATQELFNSQRSTITVAPRRQSVSKSPSPTTPPRSQNLVIRTPTTTQRPRPRQISPSPSPISSP